MKKKKCLIPCKFCDKNKICEYAISEKLNVCAFHNYNCDECIYYGFSISDLKINFDIKKCFHYCFYYKGGK